PLCVPKSLYSMFISSNNFLIASLYSKPPWSAAIATFIFPPPNLFILSYYNVCFMRDIAIIQIICILNYSVIIRLSISYFLHKYFYTHLFAVQLDLLRLQLFHSYNVLMNQYFYVHTWIAISICDFLS